jgi:hypothetical protein
MENSTNVAKIETELSTIDNITQNDYSKVGLNVYQIYPATIMYPLTGFSSAALSEQFLSLIDPGISQSWTSFNVGPLYPKPFNIYTTTNIGMRFVDIEFINSVGNLEKVSSVPITNSDSTSITNIVNINRITWSDDAVNNNIPFTTVLYAKDSSGNYRYRISTDLGSGSCIITIPNNYIGIISDLYWRSGTNHPGCKMIVKDSNNNIKATRLINYATHTDIKFYGVEALKYPLYPGDSVFFASVAVNTTPDFLRIVHAMVTLTPY